MDFSHLHPAIVHFPISIFALIGILGVISLFTESVFLKKMIFWLFCFGIIFAIAAIVSGLKEEDSIVHNEAIHELMERHESNAFIITGFYLVMFVWYWIRKKIVKKPEYVVWVLLVVLGSGLLAYQNSLGGEMVYNHGAGVEPMKQIIKQESPHQHHHGEE